MIALAVAVGATNSISSRRLMLLLLLLGATVALGAVVVLGVLQGSRITNEYMDMECKDYQ